MSEKEVSSTPSLTSKLRDRDQIIIGGLLYCGPLMLAAAERIEELERALHLAECSIQDLQEATLRSETADMEKALALIEEAARLAGRASMGNKWYDAAIALLQAKK